MLGLPVRGNEKTNPAIAFTWEPLGPYGGQARRLAVDAKQPGSCYLATGDGQVYRSQDSGRSWRLLQPGLPQRDLSIESLLVDAKQSRRLYLGGWTVRGGRGGGVFVSEDSGKSWTSLPGLQGQAIRALAQSPTRAETLVAGALDGVFLSDNAGASWRRISPDNPELKNIESVAFDPADPRIIYVGTWHLPWKTEDEGRTWQLIGDTRMGMVNDSDIFSILIDHRDPTVVFVGACTGVYRSENSGRSWNKIQGIPATSRRTQILRQHPTNPSVLYAGTTQGLWMSPDHGRRWSLMTDRRLVINDVAIHPLSPEIVMLATDNGVYLGQAGDRFEPSNAGFSHQTVAALQIDAENPSHLYAGILSPGLGSGFYVSEDRGRSWHELGEGLHGIDVFCLLQVSQNPSAMYAGTNQGLYKSSDRGREWKRVVPGRSSAQASGQRRGISTGRRKMRPTRQERQSNEFDPRAKVLALVPLHGSNAILLMTEKALYRMRMEREQWELMYQAKAGERLLSIMVSNDATGTIFLGSTSELKLSRDGGGSWDPLAIENEFYPVQAMAEDVTDPSMVYVGTSVGLFRLLRQREAVTWSRCGSGLPPVSVSAIIINPQDASELMVGDQRYGGLYRSLDRGGHWERIDSGFASARVYTLAFDRDAQTSLFVGTLNGGTLIGKRRTFEDLPAGEAGIGNK